MSQRVQTFPGRLLSAARVAAGLDTRTLAALASISTATLHKLEASSEILLSDRRRHGFTAREVWDRVTAALAARGVELFSARDGHGPGIRLSTGVVQMTFASALAAYRSAADDVAAISSSASDDDGPLGEAMARLSAATSALLSTPADGANDAAALLSIALQRFRTHGGDIDAPDDADYVALVEKALSALGG